MPKWDNYKCVSLLILAVTPRSCTSAVCTVALITTAGRTQNLYFGRLRYLSGKWPRGRADPGEKSWSRTKLYFSALLLWLLLTRKFCQNWIDIHYTQGAKISCHKWCEKSFSVTDPWFLLLCVPSIVPREVSPHLLCPPSNPTMTWCWYCWCGGTPLKLSQFWHQSGIANV